MGTKNLVVLLKAHTGSVSAVHGNMLRALASLRVFFCNYVISSLVLMLRYMFRFQVEDGRKADQTKENQFEDSEIDEFAERLVDLMFPSSEYFHVAGEETEEKPECSVSEATVPDVPKDSEIGEPEETEDPVLVESEGEIEGSAFKETVSDNVLRDVKKIDENETECSVLVEGDSNVHQEEETEEPPFMNTGSSTIASKYEFISRKDISVFVEEPSTMTFSFRDFYAPASTGNFASKEISEGIVVQEEEDSVKEQSTPTSKSCFDDSLLRNNDPLNSASKPEPISSSHLTWGNKNTNSDGRVIYQILRPENSVEEGFESESLKVNEEERVEDVEETEFSSDSEVSHGVDGVDTENEGSYHGGETMWEENLDGLEDSEEEDDDDDLAWDDDEDDDDELVQQLKLELQNAKQGGLATILEEEEEEEETESPKVVEDLRPLKIEEKKLEHKDHMLQIQKFYKGYAEKMRKLDVLNYQTIHAIGLLQLKDPLKLILMPKSAVQGANKPLIYQNLWPRKAPKHTSDPVFKFVDELHRDLELVYVAQVCLSWEILCWQHRKAQELKQYDSPWPRRYNLVAGEFQLFQVLMQRFIENEPFQGPRIQNYVKNRRAIRNLLHVPAIKDDNRKDKKITKWGEEDAIESGRLVEIIRESMQVFWEFVRADTEYGNVILKVSNKIGMDDGGEPEISNLLVDIKAQLNKKERKLKDIVRSGNCIVRKFQKQHEGQVQLDHEQLLAQVGLRLISRVVNMKKLRKDQLIWCNEKLDRINFVGRKIQVEPSFFIFPC